MPCNGDGVRTSKTVGGDTTQCVLDLAATLPVVIKYTEALYLYGLDIIAQRQASRYYYVHDGLGSVRQRNDDHTCGNSPRIVTLDQHRKENRP